MSSDVRLICFDLGRVLVRICDDWRHACQVAGIAVPEVEPPARTKDPPHLLEIVYALERDEISVDEFCRRMSPILNITSEQVRAMLTVYTIGPFPGAIELIDQLNLSGYQTACMSNTNALHWQILQDPNSSSYFPMDRLTYSFASHLARSRKPEAGFYQYVERATGLRVGQILFFDDVQENLDAARLRGWRAELILHDGDPVRQLRTHLAEARVLARA